MCGFPCHYFCMRKKKNKASNDSALDLPGLKRVNTTMTNLSNIYDVVSDNVGSAHPNLNIEDIQTAVSLASQQLLKSTPSSINAITEQLQKVPAQRRAYEEKQLVSIEHDSNSRMCANAAKKPSKCIANTLWPEEPTLKLIEFHAEGVSNCSRQCDQLCLLCLRFELLKCSMSCVQNGVGINNSMISSAHHNIVNIPGEYHADDCLFPMSPYTGIVGPIVRILKHKLQLEVSTCNGHRIFKVRQLFKTIEESVPNFC